MAANARKDKYDLLALLTTSIAGSPDRANAEEEALSKVCIEETSFPKEKALGFGGSSNVIAVAPKSLVKCVDSRCDEVSSIVLLRRDKYIVRIPKASTSMRSIATELSILRHDSIYKHPNIVDLLGLAWGVTNSPEERDMPVFILEHAGLGDLASFLDQRPSTLAQQLVLATHVTHGLRALHAAGVVHGDMKPANILLFPGGDNKPTAKLADFSSSVLLSEVTWGSAHPGMPKTELWWSPWASRSNTKEQLLRSDVYSLGLVLSVLITRIRPDILDMLAMEGNNGRTLDELKTSGDLGDILGDFAVIAERKAPGGETNTTLHLKRILFSYATSTKPEFVNCTSGVLDVLKMLRLLLHLVLTKSVREEPQSVSSLSLLEEEAAVSPSKYLVATFPGREEPFPD